MKNNVKQLIISKDISRTTYLAINTVHRAEMLLKIRTTNEFTI